jgi:hypothetical protein
MKTLIRLYFSASQSYGILLPASCEIKKMRDVGGLNMNGIGGGVTQPALTTRTDEAC